MENGEYMSDKSQAGKRPKKKRLLLYNIILAVCIVTFLGCAGYLGFYFIQAHAAESEYDALRPSITILDPDNQPEDTGESKPPVSTVVIDWTELMAHNQEVKGYIIIPNTSISYPIVQGKDNVKYLTTTVMGTYNPAGAIFMSCDNHANLEDRNTVIYGHNRNNGTMFEDLTKFLDPDFFAQNKTISIFTPAGECTYEIFQAYTANISLDYARVQFANDEQFGQYLTMIKGVPEANIAPDYAKAGDKMITLSTCTNRTEDTRVVVHAKLVDFKPIPEAD